MRKIIVKAKISDKETLIRKYDVRDNNTNSLIAFEMLINDDSETLTELCKDPRVIQWFDKKEEGPKISSGTEPENENPKIITFDVIRKGIEIKLEQLDTKDMKTLLGRLVCLQESISFQCRSGMKPITVIAESFLLPENSKEPVLLEGTVKLMLRRMASYSKSDFDKRLLEAMIDTTAKYLDHPEYLEYPLDYFLKNIFEYTVWKETN